MFDFQGMQKAMEAAQTVDFDRLAAIPDTLDEIVRQLRVANVLTAMRLAVRVSDGSNVNGILLTAESMVAIREANDLADKETGS